LEVLNEQVMGDGAISVDVLIVPPEGSVLGRVAVEVDGSGHFFANRPSEPTGRTMFKRRLLDVAVRRGELGAWVSVSGFRAGLRESERRALLCSLLERRGVDVEKYRRGPAPGDGEEEEGRIG
jgi:hypothetical protein